MKLTIPINTEIITSKDLENKVVIQIPRTNLSIMAEKLKDGKYKITLFDRYGRDRKQIAKNASEHDACIIMEYAAATVMRKSSTFKELVIEFQSILNNNG